jgi:hypothetical protein
MSKFVSKYRVPMMAGGVLLVVLVAVYVQPDVQPDVQHNNTPTPDSIGATPSATSPASAASAASDDMMASTEPMMFEAPPMLDRKIMPPDENTPPPSQTKAFCDDANWKNVDMVVGRTADGGFRVDQSQWDRAGLGSKAGFASWMSQCHGKGLVVEIVAAETGRRLAVYDPSSGLRTL